MKLLNPWARTIEPCAEWVTDTNTASALWPFTIGTTRQTNGTPVGTDPATGRPICYDPLTEFQHGRQRAAQLAVVATNGTGKSTFCKRQLIGFSARNIPIVIPNDFKGEYTNLVRHLGGNTQTLNRNGGINLVDPGELIGCAIKTGADAELINELKQRRNHLVAVVLEINRGQILVDWERSLLNLALEHLNHPGDTIHELPQIFTKHLDTLATQMSLTTQRATELIEPIQLSTMALSHSPIGQTCGTSTPQQLWSLNNSGTVIDTQTIREEEKALSAAVAITTWTAALSAITYKNHRNPTLHAIIFDEIWRATRYFPDLADRIGGLMRMDRHEGLITILATHSWTDTQQRGGTNILARCAAFALGGQTPEEINHIAQAGIGLTPTELDTLRKNAVSGTIGAKPTGGMGKFILKQGDHAGQQVQTVLGPTEKRLGDTNQRFADSADAESAQTGKR